MSTSRRAPLARLARALLAATAAILLLSMSASALSEVPVQATKGVNDYNAAGDGDIFAWSEATERDLDLTRAYWRRGDGRAHFLSNSTFVESTAGGVDGNLIVYDEWKGDANIRMYNVAATLRNPLDDVNTGADEYHPTISGEWILFTRRFGDDSRVMLYNRLTGATRPIRKADGDVYVYAGQVNGDWAVYGLGSRRDYSVYRYRLSTRRTVKIPTTAAWAYNPAVSADGTVYLQTSGRGCGLFVRIRSYAVDGTAKVLAAMPDLVDGGFMYADDHDDGSVALYYNRAGCKDRDTYREDSWDIYRLDIPA